ncbi:MAG: DEAD/DEAH box helicase [Bifidobacterium sp.]|nr:DEAD/DEAH box helicase [Bifidobacterium sp.]
MCECLELFSEPTRAWFTGTFGAPTRAQELAWPVIASGANALVIAPTGSGKTLSAFLWAIDSLVKAKQAAPVPKGRRRRKNKGVGILYLSPIKALGVDVTKNLERPLRGIEREMEREGVAMPDISVAMRSGDTPARERRQIVTNPPDILVTTPESLYLMLTSKSRETLRTVHTVIVDEVHAVAGTKRGAHLALSLERLDALLARPAQRIGLSATVNPAEQAAHFLGGPHPVHIVHAEGRPELDLKIVDPARRMPDGPQRRPGAPAGAGEISGVTPAMRLLAERKAKEGNGEGRGSGAAASAMSARVPWAKHLAGAGTTDGNPAPGTDGGSGDGEPTNQLGKSIWPLLQRSVLDQIMAHHTTLVFVNSRGLAERLTAQLNDLYAERNGRKLTTKLPTEQTDEPAHYRSSFGSTSTMVNAVPDDEAIAMAHHGSVSKERRKQIEEKLKAGKLKCVVATSSLELGIDMGSVDLVIQVAPPLSVSSGLQRVGRADHRVGGVSHALVYPLTREQVIGAAASVEGMLDGAIEPLHVPQAPLDVLAQQTVAAASMEPLDVDAWFRTVRAAYPYATLRRDMFDATMGMLTGAYNSEDFSAFRPPLMLEEDTGMLSPRPGAQRLAVTSGGTIPDRGMYTVVLPEAEAGKGPKRVGELDEEMVYESRVGDVIALGTSTWQIQEITNDRVVVTPAPGRSARLPFWHGDQAGRGYPFGRALGEFTGAMARGLTDAGDGEARFDPATLERLRHDGADDNAVDNLADLLAEQKAATGVVSDADHLVIERCRDEEQDWRVIIHSPFGRRVHEPWALAINARLRQRYGFDGQVFAADDGIVLRLPDGDGTIDLARVIAFDPDEIQRLVEAQVEGSVLFAARFRECAARALFMPRTDPSRRVPLWQQRLRAGQLLAAARTQRNFPLVLETARECLQDVYDVPALKDVLARLADGRISVHDCETAAPSPMADHLLFGFVGSVMYEGDVPQAEREARLLSMDPQVLERLLGSDELAGVLSDDVIDEVAERLAKRTFWNELDEDDVPGRVHRYLATHPPFTADTMIGDLGVPAQAAVQELQRLEASGEALTGRFDDRLPRDVPQWVARDVLNTIRSKSLAKARRAVKPVDQARFQAFVLDRQGVGSSGGERYEGTDGIMRVVEQLEGVSLPVGTWERQVFPVRVHGYAPMMLDELIASGDVVWVGSGTGEGTGVDEVRLYPADSVQLQAHVQSLEPISGIDADGADEGSGATGDDGAGDHAVTLREAIWRVLARGGAYATADLEQRARQVWQEDPEDVIDPVTGEVEAPHWSTSRFETALWSLVRDGYVTNTTFAVARHSGRGAAKAPARAATAHLRRARVRLAAPTQGLGGLWSALPHAAEPVGAEEIAIDLVEALLDRYGVVAPPIVEQCALPGGFSGLYPVLRRMEEQGALLRGQYVDGFGAAQFARRETIDLLRAEEHAAGTVALDVIDPASLMGGAIAWPEPAGEGEGAVKPMRKAGGLVVLRAGSALLYCATKSGRLLTFSDVDTLLRPACAALADACRRVPGQSVTLKECDGQPLTRPLPITPSLRAAGFTPTPQGLRLYR